MSKVVIQNQVIKIVKLIYCNIETRGKGTIEDPIRRIEQYYDLKGNLVFELDPCLKIMGLI